MKNRPKNAAEWWDGFAPIDRESICDHFKLSKELAKNDFFKLPHWIRGVFYGQWSKNNSIINTDKEWQF
jgi:hypothetical protein